jgi:hypothetical protein
MLGGSGERPASPTREPLASTTPAAGEITSGDIIQMEDASSAELLEQLNQGQTASNWL